MFIGRSKELAYLEEKYQENNFQLGIVFGRRRIGKTSLVNEFVKGKSTIYVQGSSGTFKDNLCLFSYAIEDYEGSPEGYCYPTFKSLLEKVLSLNQQKRLILVIDEFPFLATETNVLSDLQFFIDHTAKGSNIFILLTGSSMGMMEKIMSYESPLYKRNTFQLKVDELPMQEALQFFPKTISEDDVVDYLSVFGTNPFYLSCLNFNRSFDDNIQALLYNRFSPLFGLPDDLLLLEVREPSVYVSLLASVALGFVSLKDIASHMGMSAPTDLSPYLSNLMALDLLEKERNFGSLTKGNHYQIKDRFFNFYYRFLHFDKETIYASGSLYYEKQKEAIHLYLAKEFETFSRKFLRFADQKGLLDHFYGHDCTYIGTSLLLKRSLEIDAVFYDDSSVLLCEDKDCKAPVSKEVPEHLLESGKAEIFGPYKKQYMVLAKHGFDESCREYQNQIKMLNLKQMMSLLGW